MLFEHDGVAIHKDLQLGVSVQMHIGAQLLGQNDAAQRVDAAAIPVLFIVYQSPSFIFLQQPIHDTTGKLFQSRYTQYTKNNMVRQ